MELPKRQETIVLGCTRRGDSKHHLNELQRWVRAVAISADTRDGYEMLMLLQPPRSLCASTGHYPHLPSWEPVQPTLARVPWSMDNFPGRTQGAPQVIAKSRLPLPPQVHPAFRILYPSLPPFWVSHSPLISCTFKPVLPGQGTDALRWPTHRGRAKSKAEAQELCKQRREREISPSTLRSSRLNLHSQLDVPCICGVPE